VALQQSLEDTDVGPILAPGHGGQLGPERAEHLHGPGIGGLLDRHEVARVEERACDEVEALLGAVDDEDLVRSGLEAEAQQVGGQVAAQGRVARHRRVLEQHVALVPHNFVEGPPEGVGGEEAAVGRPAGERDHPAIELGRRHQRSPPILLGLDDPGAPREEGRPVDGGRRPRGQRGRGAAGRALGDEGTLPHVGPGHAGRDQLFIGQDDGRPVDAQ
jgi:hypothetical protein